MSEIPRIYISKPKNELQCIWKVLVKTSMEEFWTHPWDDSKVMKERGQGLSPDNVEGKSIQVKSKDTVI